MSTLTVFSSLVAFCAGIAAEHYKQWFAYWFVRREIRNAIKSEMNAILVTFNFYLLALENGDNGASHQAPTCSMEAFEYYWENRRSDLLKLPEWSRLKGWNRSLEEVNTGQHHPAFNVIRLIQGLTISPLDRCLYLGSRRFARQILARPKVANYIRKQFEITISSIPAA